MRAERRLRARASILCACVLAVSASPFALADATADAALAEIMRKLSEIEAAGGRFTERKYFSILNEPLILKGNVYYRSPDYVRKEYDDPDSESYEIQGDNLIIEFPDGQRRDLSIDQHPVLRAFVESYRGTLAGDLATLEKHFEVELDGHVQDWALRLTPRSSDLSKLLSAVVMLGRGGTLYSVETLEAGGDRSVMSIDSQGE